MQIVRVKNDKMYKSNKKHAFAVIAKKLFCKTVDKNKKIWYSSSVSSKKAPTVQVRQGGNYGKKGTCV